MSLYLNALAELISVQRQSPLSHSIGFFVGCVVGGVDGAGGRHVDGLGLGNGLDICDGDWGGVCVVGRRVGFGGGV